MKVIKNGAIVTIGRFFLYITPQGRGRRAAPGERDYWTTT